MKRQILIVLFLTFCLTGVYAQIFYKIEGNGQKYPSYIFGTHHMAPVSVINDYDALKYLEDVEQVVGEIDMTADPMAIAMAMQSHLLAPPDSTISKVIPEDKFETVNDTLKKWFPMQGMDLTMFEPLKPAVVTTTITAGIMSQLMPGFDPEQQLDGYFQTQGKEKGKKIIGLETPEFQAALLYDRIPISIQAQDLLELIKEPEKLVKNANKLNQAYLNGDLETLSTLSENDEPSSDFEKALLDERNIKWLEILPEIMSDGSTFIVVGALHLPGEKGVLDGLKNLGYSISPLQKIESPATR